VWPRAVELFDEMLERGIRPDVVSCTALIAALGSDAQWERAERVLAWMLQARARGGNNPSSTCAQLHARARRASMRESSCSPGCCRRAQLRARMHAGSCLVAFADASCAEVPQSQSARLLACSFAF
jgi:hypothetical protein